jgi:hypothetical protein
MVTVRQWLPGAWSWSLCPPRTRPRSRHIGPGRGLIDKDQPVGGPLLLHRPPEPSLAHNISAILFAGPQRFFIAITEPPQGGVDGHGRTTGPEPRVDLFQGGIGMLIHESGEPVELHRPKAPRLADFTFARGDAIAPPALSLELVHPPCPDFEALGDLRHRPLLLVVSF